MHPNNRSWLKDLAEKYPGNFNGCGVLEIGSCSINGTARDFFNGCDYVGVDMLSGKCVDIVCVANKTQFSRTFDTLVFLSLFEHDECWREILSHNLQWLKSGGLCVVSFGAEGNIPHYYPTFKVVPHKDFLDHCQQLGLKVVDSFFLRRNDMVLVAEECMILC
jgi:hypothetical protein